MDTVNKVVDAGYKALWGGDNATATGSNNKNSQSGINSVIDTGKRALWGGTSSGSSQQQQVTSHGEEPVSGERGLGTAMDPYDAGNREEEEAMPEYNASKPPITEQRNIESSQGAGSGTAAASTTATITEPPDMLKTTVSGLKPDPSGPDSSNNATGSATGVVADNGPGQSLKHTSEPFQEETDRLARDLQKDDNNTTARAESPRASEPQTSMAAAPAPISAPVPAPSPAPVTAPDQSAVKNKADEANSSTSGTLSESGGSGDKPGHQRKASKLEKVKNKLHIGRTSSKTS